MEERKKEERRERMNGQTVHFDLGEQHMLSIKCNSAHNEYICSLSC